MPRTDTLTITLPVEILQDIQARVDSGEFGSASELIESHLLGDTSQGSFESDRWSSAQALEIVERFERGELKTSPIDESFARLEERLRPLRETR